MRKYLVGLFCAVEVIWFVACSPVFMTVEVMKPAEVTSSYRSSFALIDHCSRQGNTVGTFEDRLKKSGLVYLNDVDKLAVRIGDSIVSRLIDRNYFSQVKLWSVPEPYHVRLTPDVLTRIRLETGASTLALFDSLKISLFTDRDRLQPAFGSSIRADVICAVYELVYRVYRLGSDEPYKLSTGDTLIWLEEEGMFPSVSTIIDEIVYRAAENAADAFVPSAVSVDRFRFTANDLYMAEAERNVRADDWVGAAELWRQVYDDNKKKSTLKGKAASNLALYYELNDQYTDALDWAEKAKICFEKSARRNSGTLKMLNTWIAELQRRKSEETFLDVQLTKE